MFYENLKPERLLALESNHSDIGNPAMMAYARIFDSNGLWQAFVYSVNPEDHNELSALYGAGNTLGVDLSMGALELSFLAQMYNRFGLGLQFDYEFRPTALTEIHRNLMKNPPTRRYR